MVNNYSLMYKMFVSMRNSATCKISQQSRVYFILEIEYRSHSFYHTDSDKQLIHFCFGTIALYSKCVSGMTQSITRNQQKQD